MPSVHDQHQHQRSRTELLHQVILGWRAMLRSGPDLNPRTGERGASDQALASGLVRSALAAPGDPSSREELTLAAAAYARLPRRRRFHGREIFRELAMLRSAVWVSLRDCFPPGAGRVSFLKQLDSATMEALREAVRANPDPAGAENGTQGHEPERRRPVDSGF